MLAYLFIGIGTFKCFIYFPKNEILIKIYKFYWKTSLTCLFDKVFEFLGLNEAKLTLANKKSLLELYKSLRKF